MDTYTSTGTVKVPSFPAKGDDVEVFFTPDCSHSIRHGDRCYAVFVKNGTALGYTLELLARSLAWKHVRLLAEEACGPTMRSALDIATVTQCKVKVEVAIAEDQSKNLMLKNIGASS